MDSDAFELPSTEFLGTALQLYFSRMHPRHVYALQALNKVGLCTEVLTLRLADLFIRQPSTRAAFPQYAFWQCVRTALVYVIMTLAR